MQVLAEWVLAGQSHQLINHVGACAACDLSVERAFLNAQSQLVQRCDQPAHGRFVIEVGQWRPAEKPRRRPKQLGSTPRASLTPRLASVRQQLAKPPQIHLIVGDIKQIARLARNDHVVPKDPPEAVHVALDDVDRRRRGALGPQFIDQPVGCHDTPLHREQREQRLLFRASEAQRSPVTDHLERA